MYFTLILVVYLIIEIRLREGEQFGLRENDAIRAQ